MKEQTISEQSIFKGRIVELIKRQVQLPDGSIAEREVILHHGGAGILPIDAEGNCYMVKQYRTAVQKELLEIPAGKLEAHEDPMLCAARELEEETGFRAEEITFLGQFIPTPGYDSEVLYLYSARDLRPGQVNLDEGEFLTSIKFPFKTLFEMVLNGGIEDAKTVIAILLTAQKHKELL